MDFSYLTSFQPYHFSATPDLSYGSTPTFNDFDMLQSPSQPETFPDLSRLDQRHFGLDNLDLNLTSQTLNFDRQFTPTENEQGSPFQSTIFTKDIPSQRAQVTRPEADTPSSTPSQDRRKEQNRAAQRAFRERRHLHNKELQAKVAVLEQRVTSLDEEHARLKRKLAKVTARNMILQARLKAGTVGRKMRKAEQEQQRVYSPPDTPTSGDFTDDEYDCDTDLTDGCTTTCQTISAKL